MSKQFFCTALVAVWLVNAASAQYYQQPQYVGQFAESRPGNITVREALGAGNGIGAGNVPAAGTSAPGLGAPVGNFPVRQVAHTESAPQSARLQPVVAVQPQPQPQPQSQPQLPHDYPRGERAESPRDGLIAFSELVTLQEGPVFVVTTIDPVQKSMCVYHIPASTGQIELKSARKIEWDLQLIYLNSKKPLPQEVERLLQTSGHRGR